MNYISMIEKVDSEYHRSKIILHSGMFYFAEFDNMRQLDFFAQMLGFNYRLVETRNWRNTDNIYKKFDVSHCFENQLFWKNEDLPEGAKPIKALSNGSIVTCYFVNDGKNIVFYRPNPNAKKIYDPLSLVDHRAHQRIYGLY